MNINGIITLLLSLIFSFNTFSQDDFPNKVVRELNYEVHGTYNRSVKKTQFNNAKLISDVVAGFPINWINSYISVEIAGTCEGKLMKAITLNDKLSAEQINILDHSDLATNIVVNVKYISKDPMLNTTEKNDMHVEMTIVPETEAEFFGGEKQLINYLKDNSVHKMPIIMPNSFKGAIIKFTINEGGEIINAKLFQKWGDVKTDQMLLELIKNMPKWNPAINSSGIKVKQDFVFSVGTGGC